MNCLFRFYFQNTQYIGDKIIQGKDIPAAMKFYHLSKVQIVSYLGLLLRISSSALLLISVLFPL